MTDNKLITENDAEFERKLRAMAGQYVGGSDAFIPKLGVNRLPEDPKTKQDLPVGAFTFKHKTHGWVFAERKKPVAFRLFAKRFGYERFDNDFDNGPGQKKGKMVSRSVQLTDFKKGSEYISECGRFKCGKANEPEGSKAVKTKIFFYGTVSFKGTTADGKEVDIVNEPVVIKQGGLKFLEIDNYFKDFAKDGRKFFDFELTLTPKFVQIADGGVYNIEMQYTDLTKKLEFNDEVFKTLQTFFDYIEAQNKAIEVKFKQVVEGKNQATEDAKHDDVVDSGDLENDFIEEEN
jgi:RNAse (barnase) inhibitor barstar